MNKAALWAKSNSISRCMADDFTAEFKDEIGQMSGRCIDIGSGPCDVVVDFVLPKLDPKATVTCADISDGMLEFAKEKYKDNHRLSFLKLDIETPDLPKDLIEHFHHATSFHCLHWCQDIRQVFENFFDLLRPGGTMLLTFIANHPGLDCYNKLAAMPRYQPYMKDLDRYILPFQNSKQPQETVKTFIKNAGFEIHHCSMRSKNHTFDNLDLFTEHILSVNPFIDRMPDDLKKEYEKDLLREFAEHSIIFNKNTDNENEYSVLCLLRVFLVYMRKPLSKKN